MVKVSRGWDALRRDVVWSAVGLGGIAILFLGTIPMGSMDSGIGADTAGRDDSRR